VILAHLAHSAHVSTTSLALFLQDQGGQVGFSPMELWGHMGNLARAVVIILFIMSIWSLAVIIDRAIYFSAARKQSREFAPRVANALKEGRLDEAIKGRQVQEVASCGGCHRWPDGVPFVWFGWSDHRGAGGELEARTGAV
jgi:hypothetical protein